MTSRHDPHAGTRWPYRARLTCLALVSACYFAILALIYPQVGVIGASLSVVPIVLAGLLFGTPGGLLASLVSVPLHALLFAVVAPAGWLVVLDQWPGSAMGVVVGVAAGWLSGFIGKVQGQAQELHREREALKAEIAERARIEAILIQTRQVVEAASSAKSAFLANMSHELRTPLSAILGFSDLMRMQAMQRGDEVVLADLEYISKAGQHLLGLINDVLDLGKIEAGKMELQYAPCSLELLVYEVNAFVQPLVQKNNNTLHIDVAEQLGSINTDRGKLQQVLLNLLSNAAKFTADGTITLTATRECHPEHELIIFAVSDTGIGIAAEHIPELFQPFTQVFSSSAHTQGGTGLGLALSQSFCALMGGSISVQSTLGAGSTFTVRLPVTLAAPRSQIRADDEAADAPLLQRTR